jgi:hypothetical protein
MARLRDLQTLVPAASLPQLLQAAQALDQIQSVSLHDLTGGLTDGSQDPLGSSVTDTTTNVLDAVGQVGNTVTGAVGDTVDGVTSALPSDLTSDLPKVP